MLADVFRFAVYTDVWMDTWTCKPLLAYSQPPNTNQGDVRLSLAGCSLLRAGQPMGLAESLSPWPDAFMTYIGTNDWFAQKSWTVRANRRAMLWLQKENVFHAGPNYLLAMADPLGAQSPIYLGNPEYLCTGTRASNAALGRVDIPKSVCDKLDPWPFVDIVSHQWLVLHIRAGLAAVQRTFYSLLTGRNSIRVAKLLRVNEFVTPINLLPSSGQVGNPYAALQNGDAKAPEYQAPDEVPVVATEQIIDATGGETN
jgi:hypothetical protein